MDKLVDINDLVRMTGVRKQRIYDWIMRKTNFLLSLDPFPSPVNKGENNYKNLWREKEVRKWLEKTDIIHLDPYAIESNRVFVIPHYPVPETNYRYI